MSCLQQHSLVDEFFILFFKIFNLEELVMFLGTTDEIFGAK